MLASNISIHALREESDVAKKGYYDIEITISIHALREESDEAYNSLIGAVDDISIHALREESDFLDALAYTGYDVFQSTLSVRRATFTLSLSAPNIPNFNPRSP